MKKETIERVQFISLCIGGLSLFLLLCAEPSNSESSMYGYEHFCDKGHIGWYLLWTFTLSVILFFIATIIRYRKSINQ